MTRSYDSNTTWSELQSFLPASYRWGAGDAPVEEHRSWRNSTLHIDRFKNPAATQKIILLHGVGTNGRLLQIVAGAPLARAGHEVVALDMPFYGMTENNEKRIRWEDWVEIGADLVRREIEADGRPVVLYGLSAGGMLAYDIAAVTRQVSGIMGMCFIDAGSPLARRRMSARPNMDEVSFKLLAALPNDLLAAIRVPMKMLVKMKALVNDTDALRLLLADKTSAGASVTLEFVDSMIQYVPAIAFEDFDLCPIILLQPGDDRWTPFPVTEPFWSRVAASKQMIQLDNASHFPIEQPGLDQMRDAILNFIHSL